MQPFDGEWSVDRLEEYDNERHAYFRKTEVAPLIEQGYSAGSAKLGLITPGQRKTLVDWLSKVHAAAPAASGGGPPLSLQSLFLAVNILDRFLFTAEGGRVAWTGGGWKFTGLACLGLGCKYEDSQPPSLWGLAVVATSGDELGNGFWGGGSCRGADGDIGVNLCAQRVGDEEVRAARKKIIAMEHRVLSALGYHLTVPTTLTFLGEFIHRASLVGFLPNGPDADCVREEAQEILLRVLRDSSSLSHLPSALAAAALYRASSIATPEGVAPSSSVFFKITDYQLRKLRPCVQYVRAVHTEGSAGGLGRRFDGSTRGTREAPVAAHTSDGGGIWVKETANGRILQQEASAEYGGQVQRSWEKAVVIPKHVLEITGIPPPVATRSGDFRPTSPHATSSSITAAADPSAAPTRLIGADAHSKEYDDDRHLFLRKQEVAQFVEPGYLAGPGKPGLVTPGQRKTLVDWLSKVHAAAPAASGGGPPLSLQSLFLAVNILDRFLLTAEGGRVASTGGGWKFTGLACLGLGCKYEDSQPPSLWGLAVVATSGDELGNGFWGGGSCRGADGGIGVNLCSQRVGDEEVRAARKKIVAMEHRVLSALGYHLTVPTTLTFLGEFIHRASLVGFLPNGPDADCVREEAQEILLRVLRDSSSLSHLPSALAAAALYRASSIATPEGVAPSSSVFFKITDYQLRKLRPCVQYVRAVHTEGSAGGLGRRFDGSTRGTREAPVAAHTSDGGGIWVKETANGRILQQEASAEYGGQVQRSWEKAVVIPKHVLEITGIPPPVATRSGDFRPTSPHATSSSITAAADPSAAPTRLIGADAHSEEYDDDRHLFLRKQEVAQFVEPGYLAGPGKPGLVTPGQRKTLVDWLSKVHAAAPAASGGGPPLSLQSLFLAVNILDRFLFTAEGGRVASTGGGWKFTGLACLGLGCKYEDSQPPSLWGLAVVATSGDELGNGFWGGGSCRGADGGIGVNLCSQRVGDEEVRAARKKIVAMEHRVLSALGYHLTVPTTLTFLGEFIHRASLVGFLPNGPDADCVREEAQEILLRVLRDSSSLSHLPSALAAAVLYRASSIATPEGVAPSSSVFFKITDYQLRKLRPCVQYVRAVHTEGSAGGLGRRLDGSTRGTREAPVAAHTSDGGMKAAKPIRQSLEGAFFRSTSVTNRILSSKWRQI